MLTRIDEFRPGNKTIWIVFDEESELSGLRMQKSSPDQVVEGKRTPEKNKKKQTLFFICLVVLTFSQGNIRKSKENIRKYKGVGGEPPLYFLMFSSDFLIFPQENIRKSTQIIKNIFFIICFFLYLEPRVIYILGDAMQK